MGNSNAETQRISKLEDKIFNTILDAVKDDIAETKTSVLRIEKILIGNGSDGILQKVSKNSAKIKIMMWALSIIVGVSLAGSGIIAINNKINSNLEIKPIELNE